MYPIGIPLLYAYILWRNRESLNPCAQTPDTSSRSRLSISTRSEYPVRESQAALEERIEKRRQNPDLVPSMFLWKDFGESEKNHKARTELGLRDVVRRFAVLAAHGMRN